jgi:hypothetical protein
VSGADQSAGAASRSLWPAPLGAGLSWRARIVLLAAAALVVRLVVIALTDGGADLAIY